MPCRIVRPNTVHRQIQIRQRHYHSLHYNIQQNFAWPQHTIMRIGLSTHNTSINVTLPPHYCQERAPQPIDTVNVTYHTPIPVAILAPQHQGWALQFNAEHVSGERAAQFPLTAQTYFCDSRSPLRDLPIPIKPIFFTPAHRSAPAHQIFWPNPLLHQYVSSSKLKKLADFYRASSYMLAWY